MCRQSELIARSLSRRWLLAMMMTSSSDSAVHSPAVIQELMMMIHRLTASTDIIRSINYSTHHSTAALIVILTTLLVNIMMMMMMMMIGIPGWSAPLVQKLVQPLTSLQKLLILIKLRVISPVYLGLTSLQKVIILIKLTLISPVYLGLTLSSRDCRPLLVRFTAHSSTHWSDTVCSQQQQQPLRHRHHVTSYYVIITQSLPPIRPAVSCVVLVQRLIEVCRSLWWRGHRVRQFINNEQPQCHQLPVETMSWCRSTRGYCPDIITQLPQPALPSSTTDCTLQVRSLQSSYLLTTTHVASGSEGWEWGVEVRGGGQ